MGYLTESPLHGTQSKQMTEVSKIHYSQWTPLVDKGERYTFSSPNGDNNIHFTLATGCLICHITK